MRATLAAAIATLVAARAVYADCTYHNGYYNPVLSGACSAETMVPAGCPLHVVTPGGGPARFTVYRGTAQVMLQSTTTLVDTIAVPMETVDVFSCDCARTRGSVAFDRHAVTLAGVRSGDTVAFDPGQLDEPSNVTITAPGPCPPVVWPTTFTVATQCDRCPTQPSPSSSSSSPGACSTGGDAGWLVVLALAVAIGVARRRRPSA